MSNHHYIKGLRRKAARHGLGRGMGNVAALAAYVQEQDKADRERIAGIQRIKAEKRLSAKKGSK